MVTRGYVQLAALVVGPAALLAVLLVRGITVPADIDGYALGTEWFDPLRATLLIFLGVSIAYGVAAFAGHRMASLLLAALGAIVGLVGLVMLAGLVAPPAWSYAGILASMVASALALGGTLMAMSWGHWYLTNSGLPKEPLEQMSLLVTAALALQAVLLVIGVALPARDVPLSDRRRTGGEPRVLAARAGWPRVSARARATRVQGGDHPRNDVGDGAVVHRDGRGARGRGACARFAVRDGGRGLDALHFHDSMRVPARYRCQSAPDQSLLAARARRAQLSRNDRS
jgi:hypothetical protein